MLINYTPIKKFKIELRVGLGVKVQVGMACVCAYSVSLCNPLDSFVHRIFQARILLLWEKLHIYEFLLNCGLPDWGGVYGEIVSQSLLFRCELSVLFTWCIGVSQKDFRIFVCFSEVFPYVAVDLVCSWIHLEPKPYLFLFILICILSLSKILLICLSWCFENSQSLFFQILTSLPFSLVSTSQIYIKVHLFIKIYKFLNIFISLLHYV